MPERLANGGDWTNGLPVKVRAWATLIGVVGVSGVISLYLVYVMAKTIPDMQHTLLAQQLQDERHREDTNKVNAEIKMLLEKILLSLQIKCAQDETTREGRRKCFEMEKPGY